MFRLFVTCGIAYGAEAGTVKSDRDVAQMMRDDISAIAPYVVFVFFAAHLVAMFNWARFGPIIAINGAKSLQASSSPSPLLLGSVLLPSSFLDSS